VSAVVGSTAIGSGSWAGRERQYREETGLVAQVSRSGSGDRPHRGSGTGQANLGPAIILV